MECARALVPPFEKNLFCVRGFLTVVTRRTRWRAGRYVAPFDRVIAMRSRRESGCAQRNCGLQGKRGRCQPLAGLAVLTSVPVNIVPAQECAHDYRFQGAIGKCSAARIDGRWIDVYKDPVTDRGKQSSAAA